VHDLPTADEILGAIARLLREDVLERLDGPVQHEVRVAASLCAILEREARLGPATTEREASALRSLLGVDAPVPELNARLVDAIDMGTDDDRATFAVLMDVVRGKLAIAKPGYDDYDSGVDEVP
jgi:hypothetical protein